MWRLTPMPVRQPPSDRRQGMRKSLSESQAIEAEIKNQNRSIKLAQRGS
jgi:hypothetical protein